MVVNHLQNTDPASKWLALSFGRQPVAGHLCWSKVESKTGGGGTDTDGTTSFQITAYNALGEGEWDGCEGAYYKGVEIPPSDYHFHAGAHATGMTTGAQVVDRFFPKDAPHSRTAGIGYKVPVGMGNQDNKNNPPTDFRGIFRTKKCPNYNSYGGLYDYSYSANPARAVAEVLRSYARIPNVPPAYQSAAQYWLSRIDWGAWVDFCDFHSSLEYVDYTSIADFDGFGLTATYYSGTSFNTFAAKFVHANFDINYGSPPPAANVSAGNFSGKFQGFIKFPTTEQWTIWITHDNGARLWLNYGLYINQWTEDGQWNPGYPPPWVDGATFYATANNLVPIEMHWNDGGVVGNFKVEWESPSTPRQVIPSKYLYPKPEYQPRYESHVYFEQPVAPAFAIREILRVSNSLMQDVNGKLRFFCYEQLQPSFNLTANLIDSFSNCKRRDLLQSNPVTTYEAEMVDLDLQYLEKPAMPIQYQAPAPTRRDVENVRLVKLYNTTRWRALKNLKLEDRLAAVNDLLFDAKTLTARSYRVTAGDLINVEHRKLGNVGGALIPCLVIGTAEAGVSENAEEPETRTLTLKVWN